MSKSLAYRWLVGAFLALFIALQSSSIAHAAEHIEAQDHPDCISCEYTVLADSDGVIPPIPPAFGVIISGTVETAYPDFTSALYIRPQGRAPPPRGPPSSI